MLCLLPQISLTPGARFYLQPGVRATATSSMVQGHLRRTSSLAQVSVWLWVCVFLLAYVFPQDPWLIHSPIFRTSSWTVLPHSFLFLPISHTLWANSFQNYDWALCTPQTPMSTSSHPSQWVSAVPRSHYLLLSLTLLCHQDTSSNIYPTEMNCDNRALS